ncbi:MAG: hypothetical protein M3141_05855 [Actinomycetota bacterium]|nr:hypothetical protein [Actinomycetota bacterium]
MRRVGVEAAHEYSEASKCALLCWLEQPVAPLERGAERSVVWRREPVCAADVAWVRLEAGEHLRRRQNVDAARSKLDCERDVIEARAKFSDRRLRGFRGHESWLTLPRSRDEQPVCVLRGERIEPPERLPLDPEGLATRCENPEVATPLEQRRRQLRARGHDVLAVVEHEQHVAVRQVPPQRIGRRRPVRAAHVEHARRLAGHVSDLRNRCEIDQPHPVHTARDLTMRELQREARLPYAGRAGQGHQTAAAY